ncbi:MAG TPA: universal stress protein [Burkholderiaceae bacterium]
MYEKILVTTDGSDLSRSAALAGVEFARRVNAEVVALYVAPVYQYPIYLELIPPSFPNEPDYNSSMVRAGAAHLAPIEQAAASAGVRYTGLTVFSDATALEIVEVARTHGCDLIFIGSHGRSGWGQILLGSVTNKVLSSCDIPVLVHRLRHAPPA